MSARRAADQPFRRGAAQTAGPSHDILLDKSVDGQVRKAARTGKLDVSSLSVDSVPSVVYTRLLGIPPDQLSNPPNPIKLDTANGPISSLTSSISTRLALDGGASKERAFGHKVQEEEWTEPEELTVFKADSNMIKEIEVEVGAFGGLRTLDLSHNKLTTLPSTCADLLRLSSLNISHNAFTALPPSILLLPKLEILNVSHNSLTTISLASPIQPSDSGLSYGAGFLSTSFSRASSQKGPRPILPVLRVLDVGYNQLTNTGLEGWKKEGSWEGLRVVHLENNALEGKLDLRLVALDGKASPQLASLILNGNAKLQGIDGDPASGCKVDMEGIGLHTSKALITPTSSNPPSAGNAADAKSDSSTHPVILPSATLVYKSTPAASFDSLPLDIDMDIYLPPSSTSAPSTGYPVVIWFHGGGLLQGNKENLPPHFRRLPSHSFSGQHCIVISPNYRLAPQSPILDILADISDCISFVKSARFGTALKRKLALIDGSAANAGPGTEYKVDPNRICLSGGSAGGYLAMMASMRLPSTMSEEECGGYRGEEGIKCCAPFYPITDLTHSFWATKTDPVPWWSGSVPDEAAKPHLTPRDPPVCTAVSGGPRSILYPYMLQHALFPSLLFLSQKSVGRGGDAFRPDALRLSVTYRLEQILKKATTPTGRRNQEPVKIPPVYFIYGDIDDKINPLERDVELLRELHDKNVFKDGGVEVEVRQGADHGFDESPEEECVAFRDWLGKTLF